MFKKKKKDARPTFKLAHFAPRVGTCIPIKVENDINHPGGVIIE